MYHRVGTELTEQEKIKVMQVAERFERKGNLNRRSKIILGTLLHNGVSSTVFCGLFKMELLAECLNLVNKPAK